MGARHSAVGQSVSQSARAPSPAAAECGVVISSYGLLATVGISRCLLATSARAHRPNRSTPMASGQGDARHRARTQRVLAHLTAGEDAPVRHIHFHLPESICEMTTEQLAALTGGSAQHSTAHELAQPRRPSASSAESADVELGPATKVDGKRAPVDADGSDATFSLADVAAHNSKEDCWIVVHGSVYDVTQFRTEHPGGASMLDTVAGTDATEYFEELHRPEVLEDIGADYRIGCISS